MLFRSFLAEPDRRGILQMRSADFDDLIELSGLGCQSLPQTLQGRDERPFDRFKRCDVHRSRNDIIARLAHIDVVVRVNGFFRTNNSAEDLYRPVRDNLVRIHVG